MRLALSILQAQFTTVVRLLLAGDDRLLAVKPLCRCLHVFDIMLLELH
jgi:hypothetical protein